MPSQDHTVPPGENIVLSEKDIASKLAEIKAKLTAGGTNADMKEWYTEYKSLTEELKNVRKAKA